MMLYDWPGNVRELQNAIERAVVVSKNRRIAPEDLAHRVPRAGGRRRGRHSSEQLEKAHILQTLNEHEWNIVHSARVLGIDRSTLYSKMQTLRASGRPLENDRREQHRHRAHRRLRPAAADGGRQPDSPGIPLRAPGRPHPG
ncbi:MAG: hypothetical protein MZV70_44825 [Desulfobacterales bacterium]|nr:hypothetical protein [Desulfobacterales bacterium]